MVFLIYRLLWTIAYPFTKVLTQWGTLFAINKKRPSSSWHIRERLHLNLKENPSPKIWFHAASLGECKGLVGLIHALNSNLKSESILLTAQTDIGLRYLKNHFPNNSSITPFDHYPLVENFIRKNHITLFVLYENEIWPNTIQACSKNKVSVWMVSARMSPRAEKLFRCFPKSARILLNQIQWIQTQNQEDQFRYRNLSDTQVDIGFDFKALHYGLLNLTEKRDFKAQIHNNKTEGGELPKLAFISLHLAELRLLLPTLPLFMKKHSLTFFPRYEKEFPEFIALLKPFGFLTFNQNSDAEFLIVDKIGEVEKMCPTFSVSFVGGSWNGKGCHNLWEPLCAGNRIFFGPSFYHQENLARKLLDNGLASVAKDPVDLLGQLEKAENNLANISAMVMELQNNLLGALKNIPARIEVHLH